MRFYCTIGVLVATIILCSVMTNQNANASGNNTLLYVRSTVQNEVFNVVLEVRNNNEPWKIIKFNNWPGEKRFENVQTGIYSVKEHGFDTDGKKVVA
jgi:hypothetical protein